MSPVTLSFVLSIPRCASLIACSSRFHVAKVSEAYVSAGKGIIIPREFLQCIGHPAERINKSSKEVKRNF